jgi:4-amino-4-deoxy-L-arabinose transferase-like glycosyltransferase
VTRGALLAILGLSCVLKLGILALTADLAPVADERQYLEAGKSVAEGRGIQYPNPTWDELTQPPLYPWFLGLTFRLGGDTVTAKAVQVLLSTVAAGLVFGLARRGFGPGAGLAAAIVMAFDPTLVAFTHYLWSETLAIFWLALAAWLLFDRDARPAAPRRLLAAGGALALAALTRSFAVYLLPLLILWLVKASGDARAAVPRAAMLLLGFALALAPHTLHVHHKYGGFLLVNSAALVWYRNYNLHDPFNADWGFRETRSSPQNIQSPVDGVSPRPRVETGNPVERSRAETRLALAFVREHPGLFLRQSAMRLAEFLNPTSFLIRHLRRGYYERGLDGVRGPLPSVVREGIIVLSVASTVALCFLAVLGLFSMPATPLRSFLVVVIVYALAFHALSVGMSRYRLVLMPFLAIAAGSFAADPRASLRALGRPRRAVPAAATLLGLAIIWSLHIGKIWER